MKKEVVGGPLLFLFSKEIISNFFVSKKCRQAAFCPIVAPRRLATPAGAQANRQTPLVLERAKGIEPSYAAWE
jgi:hypothetical protein